MAAKTSAWANALLSVLPARCSERQRCSSWTKVGHHAHKRCQPYGPLRALCLVLLAPVLIIFFLLLLFFFPLFSATASVDMGTDSLIQLSLRRDFSDRTLLTIAHRLHTIIDYSRVLVMSDGAVAEFDTPARLLRDPQSLFFKMVADTGAANAQLLTHLAFEAERGVDVAAQLLGEGAALAPDALVAGLASPSVLMPTRDEREVSWGGGGGGHADREESQLRWHDHAPPEEEDEAAGEGHPAAAVPLIRASGLHF